MPNEQDTPVVIKRVRELLSAAEAKDIHLRLAGNRFDEDWLYLIIEPTHPGERASQHAHLMTDIERTLQREGYEQVLLVPAVPEHAGLTSVTHSDV